MSSEEKGLAIRHDDPMLVAVGLSGSLELDGQILRISKGGAFGMLLMVLGIEGGFVERSIRVSEISAIEIENPPFLPRYMRFSYQGAPTASGNSIRDMLAENAIIMSLIDNRIFYRIKAQIESSMLGRAVA